MARKRQLRRGIGQLLVRGSLAVLPMLCITGCSGGDSLLRQATLPSAAERYFHDLGAPPGAGPLTDFRHHDRDGLQNEDASGSYTVSLAQHAVIDHYRAACRRIGLTSPAPADTLAYYPRALCGGAAIVTVTPRCTARTCNVFVEVTG